MDLPINTIPFNIEPLIPIPQEMTLFILLTFLALPWLIMSIFYNTLHSFNIHSLDKYRSFKYTVLITTFILTLQIPFAAIIAMFGWIIESITPNINKHK